MYCYNCGSELKGFEKFCPSCGVKLDLAFCWNCGYKLSGNEKFCSHCGQKVTEQQVLPADTDIKASKPIRFLIEDDDGFLTDVPADKLDSWSEERNSASEELSENEEMLLNRMLDMLYGPEDT